MALRSITTPQGTTTYQQVADPTTGTVTAGGGYDAEGQANDWMSQLGREADYSNRAAGPKGSAPGVGVYDPSDTAQKRAEAAQRLADTQAASSRYGVDVQARESAANRAFSQQKFNTIFGQLQGLTNQLGKPVTPGGQSGTGPAINVHGVYSPQDIQQQTNAARAFNDQTYATQMRNFAQGAAGRGFASSSPLIAAMQGQLQGQNLAANADTSREIHQKSLQANADAVLKQQGAQESQFASRQQEDIARRTPIYGQQNALIAALAGLA